MLPDTPAGRQMEWLLDAIARAADGHPPTADEEARHLAEDAETGTPAAQPRPAFWAWCGAELATVRLVSVEAPNPLEVTATVARDDTDSGRRTWLVYCRAGGRPPHLIESIGVVPTIAGLVVREATVDDAAVLTDVERRSPMVIGGIAVTVDRGDDYFASVRLMERPVVGVAEVEGRVVAVMSTNLVSTRIGGVPSRRVVPNHVRVVSDFQGKSLWKSITPVVFGPLHQDMEGTISYVATTNHASQRSAGEDGKWRVQPVRALLDTDALAGPPVGRSATERDVPRVVAMLNDCHDREEGFLPYTVESLRARLERDPAQYSLDQVWLHGDAVVGVWPAGSGITWIYERDGVRRECRRAVVLDHGFGAGAGAEHDLEALLRAWCAHLAERGQDQLAVFTSAGSRGHDVLVALAAELEPFDIWPTAPEPDDSLERGWYTDATSF